MDKIERRKRRKGTIRRKVIGTPDKPRMSVYKSNANLYVQLIDDTASKTLCSASTLKSEQKAKSRANIKSAAFVGEEVAKIAAGKGIKKVVFDRSGYRYHGVVKALADAARKNGLEF